jgi:hypothetical protein
VRSSSVPFGQLRSQGLLSNSSGVMGMPGSDFASSSMRRMPGSLSEYAAHFASALRRSSVGADAASL